MPEDTEQTADPRPSGTSIKADHSGLTFSCGSVQFKVDPEELVADGDIHGLLLWAIWCQLFDTYRLMLALSKARGGDQIESTVGATLDAVMKHFSRLGLVGPPGVRRPGGGTGPG